MLALSGLITMDFSVADFTVSDVGAEVTPVADAVIVVTPALAPVASPLLLNAAVFVDEDDQVTRLVTL